MISLYMEAKNYPDAISRNIVGEIVGCEFPNEVCFFYCLFYISLLWSFLQFYGNENILLDNCENGETEQCQIFN